MKTLKNIVAALLLAALASLAMAQEVILKTAATTNLSLFKESLVKAGHLKVNGDSFNADVLATIAYDIALARGLVVPGAETKQAWLKAWLTGHGLTDGKQISHGKQITIGEFRELGRRGHFKLLTAEMEAAGIPLTAQAVSAASLEAELAKLKAEVAKAGRTQVQLAATEGKVRALSGQLKALSDRGGANDTQLKSLEQGLQGLRTGISTQVAAAVKAAIPPSVLTMEGRVVSIEGSWLSRFGWPLLIVALLIASGGVIALGFFARKIGSTENRLVASIDAKVSSGTKVAISTALVEVGRQVKAAKDDAAAARGLSSDAGAIAVEARSKADLALLAANGAKGESENAVFTANRAADGLFELQKFVGFRRVHFPVDFDQRLGSLTAEYPDYDFIVFFGDTLSEEIRLAAEFSRPGYVFVRGVADQTQEVKVENVRATIGRAGKMKEDGTHRLVGLPVVPAADPADTPVPAAAVALGSMADDWVADLYPTDRAPLAADPASPEAGTAAATAVAADSDVTSVRSASATASARASAPGIKPVVASAFDTLKDTTGEAPRYLLKGSEEVVAT